MAKECGQDINTDSATALRPKAFHFEALGFEFRYTLQVPEYVLARLKPSLDELQHYMEGYASRVVVDALKGGYVHSDEGQASMRSNVGKHLKNYVWERFCIKARGEGTEWVEVAPSLQEVRV